MAGRVDGVLDLNPAQTAVYVVREWVRVRVRA
jgi:hypothetical protein